MNYKCIVSHETHVSLANGATMPNDALRAVEDMADEVGGDITVIIPELWAANKGPYHYDYDNERWTDKDGFMLCDDGEWRKPSNAEA